MKRIIAVRKVRRLQKILSTLTPEMLYRLEQDLPATVRRAKFKAVAEKAKPPTTATGPNFELLLGVNGKRKREGRVHARPLIFLH